MWVFKNTQDILKKDQNDKNMNKLYPEIYNLIIKIENEPVKEPEAIKRVEELKRVKKVETKPAVVKQPYDEQGNYVGFNF
jgi:predicted RND superfamily exporter protein